MGTRLEALTPQREAPDIAVALNRPSPLHHTHPTSPRIAHPPFVIRSTGSVRRKACLLQENCPSRLRSGRHDRLILRSGSLVVHSMKPAKEGKRGTAMNTRGAWWVGVSAVGAALLGLAWTEAARAQGF